jgi:hypothetical protein
MVLLINWIHKCQSTKALMKVFSYINHIQKKSLQRVFNPWKNKIDRPWLPNNVPDYVSILKISQPADTNWRTHAKKQGSRKVNCTIYTSNGPLETTLPFSVRSSTLLRWSERNNCCKFNWLSLSHTYNKQVMKAQRGSRGIPLLFPHPRERDLMPIVLEGAWASETVWTGAENFASTGIRTTDRPARSE